MDLMEFETRAKAAFEQIEDKARQLGLYLDHAHAMEAPGGEMVLMVNFMIGNVAFSDRVQDPAKAGTDSIVKSMESNMKMDNWLDQRHKIQEALKAGLDPLAAVDVEDEDLGN